MRVELGYKDFRMDYHVHSDLSPDGKSGMREMCLEGVKRGIGEMVFTEHFECYGEEGKNRYFTGEYLEKYWERVEECREEFAGVISVKAGLEMGQPYLQPGKAAEAVGRYPFDFILGSVHKIGDRDLKTYRYAGEDGDRVRELYYREVLRMVRESDFDCLGHLDLFRRYGGAAGRFTEGARQEEMVCRILEELIRREKGLEVNTSGIKVLGETLPGSGVLRLYRGMGGRMVTVGSDAHSTERLGEGCETARRILKQIGFSGILRYEKREPVEVPPVRSE